MNGLTFANPDWFWGLILILPLAVLRFWSHWKTSEQMPGLVSPRLAGRLISGSSRAQRWVVFSLQCLALSSTLVALARPQLGFDETDSETDARNLIIAIDTSRSMLADDLPPNRLTRAKLAAKDIVLSLPDDRVGLIAFAGKAFVQAPLTVDHEAVLESLDQLDTEIIPRGGTNLAAAAALALETFEEAKLEQSALILFSDGESLEGADEIDGVRERAVRQGMTIHSVGVGTPEGSIIPEMDDNGIPIPGVFVKDDAGQVVRTRLIPEALQAISANSGFYVHLGGNASLTRVVEQIRNGIASTRQDSEKRLRPIERFMWPLSLAALALILSHVLPLVWPESRARRTSLNALKGSLAAILLLAVTIAEPIEAKDGLAGGQAAFDQKDYAGALKAFESRLGDRLTSHDRSRLQMGIGAAAYRMENFERAAEAFGEALVDGDEELRGQAHYNLGNTLFRRGETALKPLTAPSDPDEVQSLSSPGVAVETTLRDWEGSIEHFESALSLDPGNEMVVHNLEIVKKRLDELRKQKEEEEKKKEQEEEKKENKDEKKEENQKEDDKEKEEDKEKEKEQEKDQEQDQDKEKNQDNNNDDPVDGDQEKKKDDGKQDPSDKTEDGQDQKDPGQQPDSDGDGKEPGNSPGDEPPGESGKQDEKKPESEGESPNDKGEADDKNSPNGKPPGGSGDNPSKEPDAPQDGELQANPNQSQPQQEKPVGQASAADAKTNPQTGYSPSEARQLLNALADETEVRPILPPARGEKFKNW